MRVWNVAMRGRGWFLLPRSTHSIGALRGGVPHRQHLQHGVYWRGSPPPPYLIYLSLFWGVRVVFIGFRFAFPWASAFLLRWLGPLGPGRLMAGLRVLQSAGPLWLVALWHVSQGVCFGCKAGLDVLRP